MKRRISVRGIALHDGKLLAVKLKPYKGSITKSAGYWCLPGGGLDDGESLIDGVTREMIEETGIPPVVGNLLYIQQFSYEDVDYLEFFFHIRNGQDYRLIDLTKTSHGEAEIAEVAYIDPSAGNIKPLFLITEDLDAQADGDNPPTIFSYPV